MTHSNDELINRWGFIIIDHITVNTTISLFTF
jgi:hypothetical protein